MIPGTLRPLPKKVKEVKTEADKLLRNVEYDINNTKDIYADSSLFTFEEINSHYIRILEQYSQLVPLAKEADKLVDKYVNDYLLNQLVYGLYTKLDMNENRLKNDLQRLDTILMSKRKKYIEEMIPRLREEMRSKLSFMKDLSFDEILEKGQIYGATISEIVGKIEAIRDEYQKLSSGSFDVSEFYSYLDEKLYEVEEELAEFELILRTCKMQMFSEEAEQLIEEGEVIKNEFELEQTSELVIKGDEYVKKATEKFEEMEKLKVSLPRRGITKDFSNNFKKLSSNFDTHKTTLSSIIGVLSNKTIKLSSQIERINAIKEIAASDGEEVFEAIEKLDIKRKGTFKTVVQNGGFPVFEVSPLGKLKMPLGVELTTPMIEEILKVIDEIEKTPVKEDLKNQWSTFKVGEVTASVGRKLAPAWNKTKEITSKAGKKIGEVSKNAYTGTKNLISSSSEKEKSSGSREKKKKTSKEKKKETNKEIEAIDVEVSVPKPPSEE